ncbi:lysine--tRNA ligase [Candidatus Peregrinibacteria bacterium]|jgi:lysyl-tRNA synthetase, class I|nr:lysine--tRNA ligase [Candidatus Peregrinibacteria bacterium]MBT4367701.1 lysine--tRNA ligase [Candidatus Peregrinibacteria bacterium]MBT4585613.1 lysine--tRNA ligase [Candidatus Peregrinibacteria bacterium]MBT7009918.1 lysine--tRNA ligase [Candidatus Peregrinibacteria bacterium]MBT7345275.1 lysine--tRNA ligase [Candidatus Peregrinibacteria bacterium]
MHMFWADQLVEDISQAYEKEISAGETLIIRDEKTLSGRVHIGSLRGIVIHGLLAQILSDKGIKAKFLFELNDFDPMDGMPVFLDKSEYDQHMGKSLYSVPAHKEGFENFPMVFAQELEEVVGALGLPIEFYKLRPLYLEGKFDTEIKDALDNADKIRSIYKEVSGGEKPENWYPLSVICEKCGKIGTTQVTGWDGKKVSYTCRKHMVTWAEGCEHEGSVSPFGGTAKLPWKAEWPAKWKVMNVHIEGAGKDHCAAGGSREIGKRISEEIFKYNEPFNIPYEFFNIAGKKMSASKGLGSSAKEISDMLPPTLLRLLMIRKQPNQPIDFDPKGKTIPNLFDEYDRLSDHYFKRHKEPYEDFARIFQMAHIDSSSNIEDLWRMRFTTLSFILQMPHLNEVEEAEKLKGEPLTNKEIESLNERALYMRKWLDTLAPDEYKYVIPESTPSDLKLNDAQNTALLTLKDVLSNPKLEWDGMEIHQAIHLVKEEQGISPKELFQPLYKIFLGRTSGPQVGWFLSTFERDDVTKRLMAACC